MKQRLEITVHRMLLLALGLVCNPASAKEPDKPKTSQIESRMLLLEALHHRRGKDFRGALECLAGALRADSSNHEASQLAWSILCHDQARFPAFQRRHGATAKVAQFSPDGRTSVMVNAAGEVLSYSLQPGVISRHGKVPFWNEDEQEEPMQAELVRREDAMLLNPRPYDEKASWVRVGTEPVSIQRIEGQVEDGPYPMKEMESPFNSIPKNADEERSEDFEGVIDTPEEIRLAFKQRYESADTWTDLQLENMGTTRYEYSSWILPDGRILRLGGSPLATACFVRKHHALILCRRGEYLAPNEIEIVFLDETDPTASTLLAAPQIENQGAFVSPDGDAMVIYSDLELHYVRFEDLKRLDEFAHHGGLAEISQKLVTKHFPLAVHFGSSKSRIQVASQDVIEEFALLGNRTMLTKRVPDLEGFKKSGDFLVDEGEHEDSESKPVEYRAMKRALLAAGQDDFLNHYNYLRTDAKPQRLSFIEAQTEWIARWPSNRLFVLDAAGDRVLVVGPHGISDVLSKDKSLCLTSRREGEWMLTVWSPTPQDLEFPGLVEFLENLLLPQPAKPAPETPSAQADGVLGVLRSWKDLIAAQDSR